MLRQHSHKGVASPGDKLVSCYCIVQNWRKPTKNGFGEPVTVSYDLVNQICTSETNSVNWWKMNLRQRIIATESVSLVGLLTIIWIRSQIISQAGLNLDHGCYSSSLVIWNLLGPIAYILHCFNTNTGKTNKASHVCIHEQQNANQNIVSHCDKLAVFLPFH